MILRGPGGEEALFGRPAQPAAPEPAGELEAKRSYDSELNRKKQLVAATRST